jgi:hypothetical protein
MCFHSGFYGVSYLYGVFCDVWCHLWWPAWSVVVGVRWPAYCSGHQKYIYVSVGVVCVVEKFLYGHRLIMWLLCLESPACSIYFQRRFLFDFSTIFQLGFSVSSVFCQSLASSGKTRWLIT